MVYDSPCRIFVQPDFRDLLRLLDLCNLLIILLDSGQFPEDWVIFGVHVVELQIS